MTAGLSRTGGARALAPSHDLPVVDGAAILAALEGPDQHEPLSVSVTLRNEISNPHQPPALDALLAFARCLAEGRPPMQWLPNRAVPRVEIPVARSDCGRFHLATSAQLDAGPTESVRGAWKNKRFPIELAQAMGDGALKRVNLANGACKSQRVPQERGFVPRGRLHWYCVGDRRKVAALLGAITHLGKHRGDGLGAVARRANGDLAWTVEPVVPWGDGFPTVREGLPLRPLPEGHPGVDVDRAELGYACLTYPYWILANEELVYLPSRA